MIEVKYFSAPWCGPCKMLAPIMDKVKDETNGIMEMTKFNIDETPELAKEYGISAVPSIIFIKNGEVVKQMVGVQPKQKYIDTILELNKEA
jgi:thioredoxin 1